MRISLICLGGFAALCFAGCVHQARAPESALESWKIPRLCLGRAMSVSTPTLLTASDEEKKKVYFRNYAAAFLDAKEQRKYIACLEADPRPEDYRAKRRDAERWLKASEATAEQFQAYFPAERRIADAEESFADIDAQRAIHRITVTLRDGSQTVLESEFVKTPR